MIQLSSTPEYDYYAVPVPREAGYIKILEYKGTIDLYYEMEDHAECVELKLAIKPELLGVIGKGELNDIQIECEVPTRRSPLRLSIKSMLPEKGILVENPMKHPKDYMIEDKPGRDYFEGHEKDWQSYESRLVKAVILKVKK